VHVFLLAWRSFLPQTPLPVCWRMPQMMPQYIAPLHYSPLRSLLTAAMVLDSSIHARMKMESGRQEMRDLVLGLSCAPLSDASGNPLTGLLDGGAKAAARAENVPRYSRRVPPMHIRYLLVEIRILNGHGLKTHCSSAWQGHDIQCEQPLSTAECSRGMLSMFPPRLCRAVSACTQPAKACMMCIESVRDSTRQTT
jgi:hypothetical protein